MSNQIKVIKKEQGEQVPFDADLALTEAWNAEKVFALHLKRCDNPTVAEEMAEVFLYLGNKFKQKVVDLREKVS